MKQTMIIKTGILLTAFVFGFSMFLIEVSAHGDEEHAEAEMHTTAEMSAADIKKMEELVEVLKKLIAALIELRTHQAPPVAADMHIEAEHQHEATTEHEEAEETTTATPETKLVIELEEHSGKTHVHVRYVDKPEEMFFVDAALSNEAGVIVAITAKTGLAADVVKAAIKYVGM